MDNDARTMNEEESIRFYAVILHYLYGVVGMTKHASKCLTIAAMMSIGVDANGGLVADGQEITSDGGKARLYGNHLAQNPDYEARTPAQIKAANEPKKKGSGWVQRTIESWALKQLKAMGLIDEDSTLKNIVPSLNSKGKQYIGHKRVTKAMIAHPVYVFEDDLDDDLEDDLDDDLDEYDINDTVATIEVRDGQVDTTSVQERIDAMNEAKTPMYDSIVAFFQLIATIRNKSQEVMQYAFIKASGHSQNWRGEAATKALEAGDVYYENKNKSNIFMASIEAMITKKGESHGLVMLAEIVMVSFNYKTGGKNTWGFLKDNYGVKRASMVVAHGVLLILEAIDKGADASTIGFGFHQCLTDEAIQEVVDHANITGLETYGYDAGQSKTFDINSIIE
jgi:hypothetical protein